MSWLRFCLFLCILIVLVLVNAAPSSSSENQQNNDEKKGSSRNVAAVASTAAAKQEKSLIGTKKSQVGFKSANYATPKTNRRIRNRRHKRRKNRKREIGGRGKKPRKHRGRISPMKSTKLNATRPKIKRSINTFQHHRPSNISQKMKKQQLYSPTTSILSSKDGNFSRSSRRIGSSSKLRKNGTKRRKPKLKTIKKRHIADDATMLENLPILIVKKSLGKISCQIYYKGSKMYSNVLDCNDKSQLPKNRLVRRDGLGRAGEKTIGCFAIKNGGQPHLRWNKWCNTPGYTAKYFYDTIKGRCVPVWENVHARTTLLFDSEGKCKVHREGQSQRNKRTNEAKKRDNSVLFQENEGGTMCRAYLSGHMMDQKPVECKEYVKFIDVIRVGQKGQWCYGDKTTNKDGIVCMTQFTHEKFINKCSKNYEQIGEFYLINGKCEPTLNPPHGASKCPPNHQGQPKCFPEFGRFKFHDGHHLYEAGGPNEVCVCDKSGNCKIIQPKDMDKYDVYVQRDGKYEIDYSHPNSLRYLYIACVKMCGSSKSHCFETERTSCYHYFQNCKQYDLTDARKLTKNSGISSNVDWVYLNCYNDDFANCQEYRPGMKYNTVCPRKTFNSLSRKKKINELVPFVCLPHCETEKRICFRVRECKYFQDCEMHNEVDVHNAVDGDDEPVSHTNKDFLCENKKPCDSYDDKRKYYCPAKDRAPIRQHKIPVASLHFCDSKTPELKMPVRSCNGRYALCTEMDPDEAEMQINIERYQNELSGRYNEYFCENNFCKKQNTRITTICPRNQLHLLKTEEEPKVLYAVLKVCGSKSLKKYIHVRNNNCDRYSKCIYMNHEEANRVAESSYSLRGGVHLGCVDLARKTVCSSKVEKYDTYCPKDKANEFQTTVPVATFKVCDSPGEKVQRRVFNCSRYAKCENIHEYLTIRTPPPQDTETVLYCQNDRICYANPPDSEYKLNTICPTTRAKELSAVKFVARVQICRTGKYIEKEVKSCEKFRYCKSVHNTYTPNIENKDLVPLKAEYFCCIRNFMQCKPCNEDSMDSKVDRINRICTSDIVLLSAPKAPEDYYDPLANNEAVTEDE